MRAIEDFWLPQDGDDWAPAVGRAQATVLATNPEQDWRRYRTSYASIVFGARKVYNFGKPLDLFGLELVGDGGDVELRFPTDGIRIHAPSAKVGSIIMPGSHPSGYGGVSRLRDLTIVGREAPGSVGVYAYMPVEAENVKVQHFGSHGWQIDAAATGRPYRSNANRFYLERCWALNNGAVPGVVGAAGTGAVPGGVGAAPEAASMPGCGLYINGPDTNCGYTKQFYAGGNAGWAIYDSSFLGCTHVSPSCAGNGHITKEARYDVGVGERLDLAYCSDSRNTRSTFINPYIEGERAVFDLEFPSLALGGIGGRATTRTTLLRPEGHRASWIHTSPNGEVEFGAPDALARFGSSHDHPSYHYALKYGAKLSAPTTSEVATAPLPVTATGASTSPFAGFFRLDYANLGAGVAAVLTAAASYAPDGRKLKPGRVALLERYEGPTMAPVLYGESATPPPITTELPVGTQYHLTRPLVGAPVSYIIALQGSKLVWRVLAKLDP